MGTSSSNVHCKEVMRRSSLVDVAEHKVNNALLHLVAKTSGMVAVNHGSL